jgi:N-acetylglucosamine malate deacetylase 1
VYGVLPMNVIVDITDVAEQKSALIGCWRTQMQRRDWAHYALGMNAFNCRYLPNSSRKLYGECFFVVPLAEYLDLCRAYFAEPEIVYQPSSYTRNAAQ